MVVQRKELEVMERKGIARRYPFFFGLLGLVVAVAISVPLVAYVVIPAFTRSPCPSVSRSITVERRFGRIDGSNVVRS